MQTLITIAFLAFPATACSAPQEAANARPDDAAAAAVRIAVLTQVLELAEQDLEANHEPARPYCVAVGQGPYPESDPAPEVLDAVERPGREVLPMSQCDLQTFVTLDGRRAGLVWAASFTTDTSTLGAGGFVFEGDWGQEFECPVEQDGEDTKVGVCRITARI